MADPNQRSRESVILWISVILFGLFGAQTAFQLYRAHGMRLDVNADLSAELADATIIEEKLAPPSAGWPQWRGPHRDGVVHAPDLLTDWPRNGPATLWHKTIGIGYSSFAVKDGWAYTLFSDGEYEVVVCWDVKNGEERWRHSYECAYSPQFPGPRSTPTLDGDRLYTVGTAGTFLCLNAKTGKQLWQHELLGEFNAATPKWGVTFSPLIDDDLVFTNPGGRNGHSLAAFNKNSGELVWNALDDLAGYSSPIAVTIGDVRQIVFLTANHLVGVRAKDGELCWRFPWNTSFEVNAATPLAFQARKDGKVLDYVFISSGYDKGCALVKIASLGDGKFEAKKVYQGNQLRSHFASPVRRGAYLFGLDEARLICMDLRTGEVKWSRSGFNKGSLLLVDDYLLVLGENGDLALIEASNEEKSPTATARPFRNRCWTLPALAEGRLFLRAEEKVKCLDLRKK
jgi:outer membrane protein assembly factor BamB